MNVFQSLLHVIGFVVLWLGLSVVTMFLFTDDRETNEQALKRDVIDIFKELDDAKPK